MTNLVIPMATPMPASWHWLLVDDASSLNTAASMLEGAQVLAVHFEPLTDDPSACRVLQLATQEEVLLVDLLALHPGAVGELIDQALADSAIVKVVANARSVELCFAHLFGDVQVLNIEGNSRRR